MKDFEDKKIYHLNCTRRIYSCYTKGKWCTF